MKRYIGDREICVICGQEIEWHGRAHGWIDRGKGRDCLPYHKGWELKFPKGKHRAPRQLSLDAYIWRAELGIK